MADSKVSDLSALTGANVAAGDLLEVVDVSDTSLAASGTNKKVTAEELVNYTVPTHGGANLLKPTGALAETYPRSLGGANIGTLTSGTLKLVACVLPKDLVVTSITWVSGSTALNTGTNAWTSLHDSSRNLLRQSTTDTSPVWGANAAKTFTLSSTFTTTYTGLHYLGLMIAATTVPSLTGQQQGSGTANVYGIAPILVGNSTTGLTGTAPNPAAALTASIVLPYAYVS